MVLGMSSWTFLENLEDATNIKNFILKSCEEFVTAENVSGLTKILNEIPLVPFPCFYLGPLTAKLQLYQKLSNDDFHSLILRIIQIPVDLADYSKDANLAMFCKFRSARGVYMKLFCDFQISPF